MKTSSIERLNDARKSGDEIGTTFASTICFEWGLQNIDGAWFTLLREPHHTDEHIEAAKRALRNSRDVVTLSVERLD